MVIGSVLLATACASDADGTTEPERSDPVERRGRIDLTLVRDDVACDDESLGSDDEVEFTTAHVVVDGMLGAVCFGDEDDAVLRSWELLATIAPPGQLTDLGLFGGFAARSDESDGETLAFVNALDDDGSLFQMSVNVDAAAADPDEAALTLAHEFSHVFNGVSTQLDRSFEAIESCTTYDNGEGCYEDDALMWAWIQAFWGGGLIDTVDPFEEATADGGQDRCDRDPSFFGAYAASNPEEDFAEAFAAFVFRVDPMSDAQAEKLDWMAAQPGLAEFRDRARAAELGPLPHTFDACGDGDQVN